MCFAVAAWIVAAGAGGAVRGRGGEGAAGTSGGGAARRKRPSSCGKMLVSWRHVSHAGELPLIHPSGSWKILAHVCSVATSACAGEPVGTVRSK